MTTWVHWIEPFGPNNEPVYCAVPRDTAIAQRRAVAKQEGREYFYEGDEGAEKAFQDFVTVHWGDVEVLGHRDFPPTGEKATNDDRGDDKRALKALRDNADELARHKGRPMDTAPKDGTTVRLFVRQQTYRAYWDNELGWVTVHEQRINRVNNPIGWEPNG